ncbi:radical SAM protein [Eggerthellaceae bacterium 3-80]|nr:radical SAM protein [bacterium D16-34]
MSVNQQAQQQAQICTLCPRACGVRRQAGQSGFCGAANTVKIARAALHMWEEPCISGDRGSGTIFFSYCPLRCSYCQNANLATGKQGVEVTEDRLVDICLELQAQGALNINMVTPTHYSDVLRRVIAQARKRGLALPIVWNTSGYELVDQIEANVGFVDVYLTDFKYADPDLAHRYSQAADYPDVAIAALDKMVEVCGRPQFDEVDGMARLVKGVVVRHLLLPGALDNSKQVIKLLHERYGDAILLSIMNQYTPLIASRARTNDSFAVRVLKTCPELAHSVDNETYEALLDYADEIGCEDYYWQEGSANLESFIPEFDLTGVLD